MDFYVLAAAAPSITSVSPAIGFRGTTVNYTLTGLQFDGGNCAVSITGTGVTAIGTTCVNATTITGQLAIADNATLTARTINVTTNAGSSNPGITFTVEGFANAGRGKLIGRGGR